METRKRPEKPGAARKRRRNPVAEIFFAIIKPDKTLCGCFRTLFRPNEEVSFVPHRIFYVDDPTGEKEAFAEIIPAHQDCKLKLSIPLSLLQLRPEDEQALHERYYVPKKYFEKLSIAIHVDEQLADDNLLDRESITQEEFGLASN